VAGICFQVIGVFASLLLAAVLLGFGAGKLFYPRLRSRPESRGSFCSSSRVRASTKPGGSAISSEDSPVDIQGPGGLIGYRFSDENRGLLPAALGPVGSVLLVVGVYLTTLFWLRVCVRFILFARWSTLRVAAWRRWPNGECAGEFGNRITRNN
jgi:hypothetical protein